jgi:hypothetical protein
MLPRSGVYATRSGVYAIFAIPRGSFEPNNLEPLLETGYRILDTGYWILDTG